MYDHNKFYAMLIIEASALCMLGKHFHLPSRQHPQPKNHLFIIKLYIRFVCVCSVCVHVLDHIG